jgi:hypothetical protein
MRKPTPARSRRASSAPRHTGRLTSHEPQPSACRAGRVAGAHIDLLPLRPQAKPYPLARLAFFDLGATLVARNAPPRTRQIRSRSRPSAPLRRPRPASRPDDRGVDGALRRLGHRHRRDAVESISSRRVFRNEKFGWLRIDAERTRRHLSTERRERRFRRTPHFKHSGRVLFAATPGYPFATWHVGNRNARSPTCSR